MKRLLLVISVLGLLGAGGAIVWSVLFQHADAPVAHEVADSFNLQADLVPVRSGATAATARRLPAASSLTRPIADAGMSSVGAPQAADGKRRTVITPKAEEWAKKRASAAGMTSLGPLSSARGLRAFLGDAKQVDAYMNSPLVRVTLNSPTAAKALLGNPALIRAFLATPALRDPQAVSALLSSPMLRKMLDCPAIQEALGDSEVVRKMVADPQTVSWIAAHPQALLSLAGAAPALGEAFTAKTR